MDTTRHEGKLPQLGLAFEIRAGSSEAERWPYKPDVAGSTPVPPTSGRYLASLPGRRAEVFGRVPGEDERGPRVPAAGRGASHASPSVVGIRTWAVSQRSGQPGCRSCRDRGSALRALRRAGTKTETLSGIPAPNPLLRSFLRTLPGRTVLSFVVDYFQATLEGAENIPRTGGGLIVGNHALFALDTAVLGALIVRDIGRNPRFLADRMLWKIPGFRQFITAMGALPGEPRTAEELLGRGELVVVYPGGVDDSLKLSNERYQLKWKQRAGFARVAIAAHVPIIPVVGFGIDEMYSVVGHERWVGRRLFGAERYDLPIAFGAFGTLVPRPVKQTYRALRPIDTSGDPASPADVERVRKATWEALESQLDPMRSASSEGRDRPLPG